MSPRLRIHLVGPTHPFRGGIAHYTTLLASALARRHELRFATYRRQYFAGLYPGGSDRDEKSAEPIAVAGAEPHRVLDTLLPWTWPREGLRARDADLLVLPWWVVFWAPYYAALLAATRGGRVKVVFLCHNVAEHEGNRIKRELSRRLLALGDGFLVHTAAERDALRELLGRRVPCEVTPHPSYDVFARGAFTRADARASVGLAEDERALLFFGFVRPYKGLPHLLDAMPAVLAAHPKARLFVVGQHWDKGADPRGQAAALGVTDAVRFVDEYVPNEDVERWFRAADLVVLPYVEGTGSGIAQIAFGMGRPVVATDIGAFREIVDARVGALVPPAEPAALARAVNELLTADRCRALEPAVLEHAARFSWDQLVDALESLARELGVLPAPPA